MSDETRTAAPRTKRVADPEIQAMAELDRIIAGLPDDDSVARVLAWLVGKHCPGAVAFSKQVTTAPPRGGDPNGAPAVPLVR